MKRILSALLILVVILTSVPAHAQQSPGWLRLKTMRPGAPLDVLLKGDAQLHRRYLVSVTDDALVLLDPVRTSLPPKAERFMVQTLERYPESLTRSNNQFAEGEYRLTKEGLFYRGGLIAAHDDLVRRVARTDIIDLELATADTQARWVKPTLITLAVFAGLTLISRGLFPVCIFARCD